MRRALLCVLLLVLKPNAFAHQLDEYLQVTRVSLTTNRIDLSIDLTPGVAVADQVLSVIDTDHDGQISGREAAVYANRVLEDLDIHLDERPVVLKVVKPSFPTLREMKSGVGVIRLRGSASVERLSPGRHTLNLTNDHLPAISVYLVNALRPNDSAIRITTQNRDESQQHYRLDFVWSPARHPEMHPGKNRPRNADDGR